MARVVVTGLNLLDRGGGGLVEHIVLTLLDRMQLGMENRVVGVMRTLYGQVARVEPCSTLEGLPELMFLLGRGVFWSDPIRKAVLCSVRSIARTQAITCVKIMCGSSREPNTENAGLTESLGVHNTRERQRERERVNTKFYSK